MTPSLSVILPAYNSEKTIALAIRSILAQTFSDFELILLEDGSTDRTLDIIKTFQDPRIRLISDGKNKKITARLNQGVDLARANLIARMDSDDIAFPNRFEKQIDFMRTYPDVDVLGARIVVFRKDTHDIIGLPPFHATHEELTHTPWGTFYLPHPTWMMKAAWAKQNRYTLKSLTQDQDLLLRALPTSKYACLPDVLLGYAQGPFNYRKVISARLALFRSKAKIFFERNQYKNLFNLVASTALKIAIDALASLPGLNYLFFYRMQRGGECPPDITKTLHDLIKKYGDHATKETSPPLEHTMVIHGVSPACD